MLVSETEEDPIPRTAGRTLVGQALTWWPATVLSCAVEAGVDDFLNDQ